MELPDNNLSNAPQLSSLQSKIAELVEFCAQLKQENAKLRSEHQLLISKNAEASTRVEKIINRLKQLEENS